MASNVLCFLIQRSTSLKVESARQVRVEAVSKRKPNHQADHGARACPKHSY
jgi:hypothetical protein